MFSIISLICIDIGDIGLKAFSVFNARLAGANDRALQYACAVIVDIQLCCYWFLIMDRCHIDNGKQITSKAYFDAMVTYFSFKVLSISFCRIGVSCKFAI